MAEGINWNDITPTLIERYGGQAPRYTSYPTAPMWREGFTAEAYAAALAESPDEPDAALSLYVHIPFCKKRCRFCGCASDVSDDSARFDAYLDALERETAEVAARVSTRTVRQLHLGGGTPTVLNEAQLARLLRAVRKHFEIPTVDAHTPEIALEAAPSVTTEAQVITLADLGFNRISLGVQDFTPEVQRAVDRIQSVDHTRRLIDAARSRGFRINVDLMYGLPLQRPETWKQTLDTVIGIRPNRLAVFGYAHVPWMRPHQRELEEAELPTADERLTLFRIAHDALLDAGYTYIGMDHFALPDDELAKALGSGTLSRNFQGYTVKQASRLVGFGATAIGDLGTAFAQNRPATADYMDEITAHGLATYRGMRVTEEDRLRRHVILELMCNLTLDIPDVEARFNLRFADHFHREQPRLRELADDGLIRLSEEAVRVTGRGRLFVRHVGAVFDAYLQDTPSQGPRFSKTV